MRRLLILYVVVFLVLNFFIDHPYIFYLAMTTFPVTVYLLLSKSIAGKKSQQPPQSLSSPKTFSSKSNDRF